MKYLKNLSLKEIINKIWSTNFFGMSSTDLVLAIFEYQFFFQLLKTKKIEEFPMVNCGGYFFFLNENFLFAKPSSLAKINQNGLFVLVT